MAKTAGCRRRPALVFLLVLLQLTAWTNANSELEILPLGALHRQAIGSRFSLSCNPKVENIDLITEIQWWDPQNRVIETLDSLQVPRPTMYTEFTENTKSLLLFFSKLEEEQAGQYNCTARYANNQDIMSSVVVETIVAISWDDAPPNQFPILGEDFEIKCKVRARPSPSVDWIHNRNHIKTNDHYVIEPHALRIKNVQESDDGVYVCRAVVKETGEFSERNIRVEVHVKPEIEEFENSVQEIIEGDNANIVCKGKGKPPPKYEWIKLLTQQNLNKADRYGVNEDTGVLTIKNVHRDDAGEYQCRAQNAAGSATMITRVGVIVKPKIIMFENQTVGIEKTSTLTCKAYGRPAPEITFRKHTLERPYPVGAQSDDDRVIVTNREDGNEETIAELTIDRTMRSNDGLYECIASNQGGTAIINGHLTVEFPPSFQLMKNRTMWSWDDRPVNLTCVAEAIPNATITWNVHNVPIGNDPNIRQIDDEYKSILNIIPVDKRYYTNYKCIASNKYGTKEKIIELREASKPGPVEEAKILQITATTVTFDLTPPPAQTDMPVKTITVQYKSQNEIWTESKNSTWSVGPKSVYHLDGLRPQTWYNFRFSAANDVGSGNWDRTITQLTPARTAPNVPKMLTDAQPGSEYDTSHFSNQYEVRWLVPLDNGEPIDRYEIGYCQVKRVSGEWDVLSNSCEKEKAVLATRHWLKNLYADSYYKVEVRAHNIMGYSEPSLMYIKLPKGGSTPVVHHNGPALSSGVIIGITIAVLIVIMLLIDVIFCCSRKSGIIYYMCERSRRKPVDEEDSKLGSLYGWRFPLPYCDQKMANVAGVTTIQDSGSGKSTIRLVKHTAIDEKEPLKDEKKITPIIDNGLRRETSVTFDGKRSISKTGFVGKDSAV